MSDNGTGHSPARASLLAGPPKFSSAHAVPRSSSTSIGHLLFKPGEEGSDATDAVRPDRTDTVNGTRTPVSQRVGSVGRPKRACLTRVH
jgi:hypothetical protein